MVRPHPLVSGLPVALERGRITVTKHLDVPSQPGLWAIGDCASVPQKDGITSPPTAQHALRQAKTCADNILATIRGQKLKSFGFTGLGKLASLGQRSAVAEVFGIKLKDIVAWIIWRTIYLSKFPGFDRQIRIGVDWMLDVLLPRDITQVRIFQPESVRQEHFHAGEIVFEQGDFGDKLYSIARGEAEILIDGQPPRTISAGEIFGEVAIVSDTARTGTVRAKTDLDVVSVSRPAFKTLVKHLPGVKGTMEQLLQKQGVDVSELDDELADPE